MQCLNCGFINEDVSKECKNCNVYIDKTQHAVFSFDNPKIKIPDKISNAYIIIKNNSLYMYQKSINKVYKISEDINVISTIKSIIGKQHFEEKENQLIKHLEFSELKAIQGFLKSVTDEQSENKQPSQHDSKEGDTEEDTKNHSPNEEKKVSKEMLCEKCGGEMEKNIISYGNYTGIIGALIVFILGLFIMLVFFWTIIGLIVGVLMMLMALGMGGKRQKVWKCKECGYYFVRN